MPRTARVGLLALAGIAILIAALFVLGSQSFLFSNTFEIGSRFGSVAGLSSGAQVRYQGVDVGRVSEVRLPQGPGEGGLVTMEIEDEARDLIRRNTQAQIKSDGLVGNQIVVLVNPLNYTAAAPVEEGDLIPGVDPFDLFAITDRLATTVTQFDAAASTMQQIMLDVQGGSGTVGRLLYDPTLYNSFVAMTNETQVLLANLSTNAEQFVGIAGEASLGLQNILEKVNTGDGTLSLLLNDPRFYEQLVAASDTLLTASSDIEAITANAERMMSWGALGAFNFNQLMEAGKTNWLFKDYFEERGFQDQAPFEVREQAIAQSYEQLEEERRRLLAWQQQLEQREAALGDQGSAQSTGDASNSAPPPDQQ
jgi:phospholipid/cholesterol/gamma-HCH transport system substrate-binding protein